MLKCSFENGNIASLRHVVIDTIVLNSTKSQVLLALRSSLISEGGKWALIGGYVERDETLVQAVQREVLEETGYTTTEPKLYKIIDNPHRPKEDRQNISFIYVCEALEKTGAADWESTQQKWFDLSSIPLDEEFAFDHGTSLRSWIADQI